MTDPTPKPPPADKSWLATEDPGTGRRIVSSPPPPQSAPPPPRNPQPTTGAEPVEKSWIRDQQAAGWPDWHPETYCHRCGRRNISSWYTDSAVWNEVHGGSGPIWCPVCFVLAHEKATGREQSWRLAPADVSDEVGALTRSEAAMRHERDRLRGELTGLRTAADDAVAATARADRLEEELAEVRTEASWDRRTIETWLSLFDASSPGITHQVRALLADRDSSRAELAQARADLYAPRAANAAARQRLAEILRTEQHGLAEMVDLVAERVAELEQPSTVLGHEGQPQALVDAAHRQVAQAVAAGELEVPTDG